jgi:hypothetical protein
MALDQFGSPAVDRDGNLWIRLTICGVTRLGVGDGKSMKERVGDAIRNAAMRFGVALDLWAKENLVEFAQAASAPAPRPEPAARPAVQAPPAPPAEDTGEAMKPRTRGAMFAAFSERGIEDEEQQRAGISAVIGRQIESRGELTEAEAKAVIRSLKGGAS